MNIKLFQIGFLVFLLSNTVQSETLKESFSDHFLIGYMLTPHLALI